MLYLLAIVFPPLAVLLCGKPVEALLNVVLTLCGWLPGVAHAALMVNSYQADQRTARVVTATNQERQAVLTTGESQRAVLTGRSVIGRDGRIACPHCGYRSTRSRLTCKQCRAPVSHVLPAVPGTQPGS